MASMRPPEFTGGNASPLPYRQVAGIRFNEAAGIHRRKPTSVPAPLSSVDPASMRPPEFTGGNGRCRVRASQRQRPRFNEAAGIHRRKPRRRPAAPGTCSPPRFNEAAGIHRRKPGEGRAPRPGARCFNEAAGIHRRKPAGREHRRIHLRPASMRPPEFTGGNVLSATARVASVTGASMRPPEFTGGNAALTFPTPCANFELQ